MLFGIRPEHLDLVAADQPGAFPAEVTMVESTGTAMFVTGKSAGFELHALFSHRPSLRRGDRIGLRPRPGLTHLFDAGTETRIA